MLPVGFEPTNSAGGRPQTYALDRAAIGTDTFEDRRHQTIARNTLCDDEN